MTEADRFLKESYDPAKGRVIDYKDDVRVETALSLIRPASGTVKALDIGCFNGEIGERIKLRLGPSCEMHGVDAADSLGELVEQKGIRFKQSDLNHGIDYPDDEFDLVFAGEIIEHMYDTDSFVLEVRRIIRPGGRLIVTTPNMLSFGRRVMYLLGKPVFMEVGLFYNHEGLTPAGHVRYFTHESLVRFMAHYGLREVRYVSDVINLPRLQLRRAGRWFPCLGQSVICEFVNDK